LTIADQLKTAIVLDDHLVNSDLPRLAWFHDLLRRIAVNAQILVITCRPMDYLDGSVSPSVDQRANAVHSIDLERELRRHDARAP
jgi:hypothetical protein